MHRHVAQRTSLFAKPSSITCRTLPADVILGPPLPSEILILATRYTSFSTYSTPRGRQPGKLGSAIPKLNGIPRNIDSIPPLQGEEPFRRLETYLQSPYPRQLLPIRNELLRNEVFRASRPNGQPVSKELPQAYYHTALEKKGDDLTRLIADEVAIYWCLQFSEDYTQAAKFLNRHAYHPVSALIRNTHWTVLSRQFAVHAARFDSSDSCSAASRLADNFEAYIYALYLDQGLETVYRFLCPIFLKKLYSQAKRLEIPIPTKKTVLELTENGTYVKPGQWSRFKNALRSVLFPSKKGPAKIRRIEYKGLTLPDWEVPCTNGMECTRDDCYFDHTQEKLETLPLFTPSASNAQIAEVKSEALESSDVASAISTEVSSTESHSNVSGSEATSDPNDRIHLEKGLFKRIEALINNKFERMNRGLRNHLEDLVRNRLKVEMQAERKQDRKQVLSEMSKMLNEGSDKLPNKIQKIVQTRTDLLAGRASAKIAKQYGEAVKANEHTKTEIQEIEERLAALEKALADRT